MAKFTSWFKQRWAFKNQPRHRRSQFSNQTDKYKHIQGLEQELEQNLEQNSELLRDDLDNNSNVKIKDKNIDAGSKDKKNTKKPSPLSKKLAKTKQFFTGAQKVTSGVLAKLPGGHKPLYRRYWFWTGLVVTGGVVAVSHGISEIDKTLPSKSELDTVIREQTLTIKAADGTILQQKGEATREKLGLEEMPEKLKKAFIASEDRRFREHQGVDYQGIGRAVLNNLRSQNVVQGGSTITQQLARILFLKQEKTYTRKLKEVRLAQRMEETLTKDQILERYLNLVYLGSGAYGVGDAAWVYYSKSVDDLSLTEAATIAGLTPAPSVFSPVVNKEAAKKRRDLVLQRMFEDKHINAAQKQEAMNEPITLKPSPPKRLNVESPYFTTYIQKQLPNYVSPEVLKAGGLTVETTLNPKWQELAENAVAKTLRNEGRWQRFKQGAMVAIDPRNGEIKAMVGGKDFGKNQFNRVTQAQRQPGSTFKSFVYATAIASGKSPHDSYLDAPMIVDGYEPKNFDKGYRGWITLQQALVKSVNIVAVKTLMKVGYQPTINLANKMGIESKLKPMYSLALGSNEVNLLEITSAYGTFANKGLHIKPHGIRRIFDRQGKEIWTAKLNAKRSLDADSAAIMTWMLRKVVSQGTGVRAGLGRRPVAGKTGTTDQARDLWFIGYIPQMVTGVWLGNDNNKPTYGDSGSAAFTWRRFMRKAVEGMKIEQFPKRPKLSGRKKKATIKASPIKPKRLVNRPVPKNNQNEDDSERDNTRTRSTRRRRRNRQNTSGTRNNRRSTRRRRRRNYQQENRSTGNRSTRRRRRRQRINSNTSSGSSNSSSRSNRSQRRSRRVNSNSSPAKRRSTRTNSSSSRKSRRKRPTSVKKRSAPAKKRSAPASKPSWRERLKPAN